MTPEKKHSTMDLSGELLQESQGVCVCPTLTGKLIFFYEWCKKCGICTMICPSGAIEEKPDKSPYMAHVDKCTYCSLCWRICPDFAIIKNPNWEGAKDGTK
jgi:2-oxoglutarate ferredoxin oxidoreductase subunit delta